MIDLLSLTLAGAAGAGVLQAAIGAVSVRRFLGSPSGAPAQRPPVTILKPLHGDEPMLEQALASICSQDYPVFQVVFGVQDQQDAALGVIDRLRARFPGVDISVVIDRTQHGSNRKISNLINMFPSAKHDVLVIADSDMHVEPAYLDHLVTALARPGVGLVTTLYAGLPASRSWAGKLGAAHINHTFLPGALMARSLGRQDCLGATMALNRAMLDRIGGLRALSNHLADDAVMGHLVQQLGYSVALARTVPATTVPETHMPALFKHELRWARTIQSLAPVAFTGSLLQFPLFWAALAVGLSGGASWAWIGFVLAWLVRAALAHSVNRALAVASPLTIWCLPFRDLLSVTVILASYRSDRVAWRGQVMRVNRPILAPEKG